MDAIITLGVFSLIAIVVAAIYFVFLEILDSIKDKRND